MQRALAALILLGLSIIPAHAETIGSVNSAWNLFKSHQIVVEAYDDPIVRGVSCYVSRAVTGGVGGIVGIAADPSDASVACRQIGDITFTGAVPLQEVIFTEKASFIFKTVRIVRMADPSRNVLVYLVYSTKLIDGSPKNGVTAVPVSAKIPIKK